MAVVKQFAILKVIPNTQGLGRVKELSVIPESERNNHGKLAIFPFEKDALEEIERLIIPYSSTCYVVVPVYIDSNSIKKDG